VAKETVLADDFHPLFYDELGRLTVATGRIEYMLKLCIKDLKGGGFTVGMSLAEKIRNFSDLCSCAITLSSDALDEPHRSTFQDLVKKIGALGDDRNDMIHAMWTATDDRVALRIRPERKKKSNAINWKKTRRIEIDELSTLRRKVEAAFRELLSNREGWRTRKSEL
jgi:hypothetical protein